MSGHWILPFSFIYSFFSYDKTNCLEQAEKGTRNVGQNILFCFTQPTDLEVTRNVLTVQTYVEYFHIFAKFWALDQVYHPIS